MAEDLRVWYKAIRNVVGIHLGLADKLLLKDYLLNCADMGIIGGISTRLDNFGYRSKGLKNMLEKKRKHGKSCLEMWTNAYNQLKDSK